MRLRTVRQSDPPTVCHRTGSAPGCLLTSLSGEAYGEALEHTFESEDSGEGGPGAARLGDAMSKRYEEPIEVEAPEGALEAFRWRGRHYRVRQVICRWRETGGWWEASGDAEKPWLAGDAREIWRIEAQNGAPAHAGTYELSHDLRRGTWSLFRVWD